MTKPMLGGYAVQLETAKSCGVFCGGGQAGVGGGDPRRKEARRCTGGKSRGGEKWDSYGGRKWQKPGKNMQHWATFYNRKSAKRWEPIRIGHQLGLKRTGSGNFEPPCPPTILQFSQRKLMNFFGKQ